MGNKGKKGGGFGPDVNKLLRTAQRLGCTWNHGGHFVRVFDPKGQFMCAVPSSKPGPQRIRQLKAKLRQVEKAG